MSKRIVIMGGGTFSPIRSHLSLSAPAFGTTARKLDQLFRDVSLRRNLKTERELILTKMADPENSSIVTNEDVSELIDELIQDKTVGTIILNMALCDYNVVIEDRGFHGERLNTSDGKIQLELEPSEKLVDKIRRKRPDIFLVGFKTTTNQTIDNQFLIALKMMKRSKCNLVLANDTVTRHNMIITPEESRYDYDTRGKALLDLTQFVLDRNDLTYNRTTFVKGSNVPLSAAPINFRKVMRYLVDNGGYIENNGNGFTPGHFCYKTSDDSFVSSQRTVNHNDLFENGMTRVSVLDKVFTAYGSNKPSVGARSQWMMFNAHPGYDCIVHTHNPMKDTSLFPVASQKPFQCGSLECGINTLNNLSDFNGIKAVMLDKHGSNIMFKSTMDAELIIKFINENIVLGTKII